MAGFQLHTLKLKKPTPRNTDRTWKFFRELGLIDGNHLMARNYNGIHNVWKNNAAYVVGAAPSLRHTLQAVGGWNFFNGKRTIGINHVIEDWDGFEWFMFLDKRFMDLSPYDLKNYKGVIFTNCITGMKPAENVKVFYTHKNEAHLPEMRIERGLYGSLSGVVALHLALLTWADPIYMFGLDPGLSDLSTGPLHYRDNYTGESPKHRTHAMEKYTRIMRQFDVFKPWANRLRLVTDGGNWLPWIKRVRPEDVK